MTRIAPLALTLALATPVLADSPDLLVFDYSGFELPEYHADYAAKYGASPEYAFFGDEEEAFQKLASGFRADIAHICAGSVTKWQDSGLIEPWDTAQLTYLDDLNTDLVGDSVTGDGEMFFLPTDFGSTAIAYNPDEVPAEAVATLQVFKDPAYAGRMSLPDNVDDAFALAYLATGVTDWNKVGDAEFDAATAWLREVHPNLRNYWVDAAELAQLMATGEVTISWAWNETYPAMAEEGRPIGFQREAAEGSSLWVCGFVNLKDGPGAEAQAYDYVNALLSPSATAPLLHDGFGQANEANLSNMVADQVEAAGLGPIDAAILAQLPMSQELREKQAEAFELIKAGF